MRHFSLLVELLLLPLLLLPLVNFEVSVPVAAVSNCYSCCCSFHFFCCRSLPPVVAAPVAAAVVAATVAVVMFTAGVAVVAPPAVVPPTAVAAVVPPLAVAGVAAVIDSVLHMLETRVLLLVQYLIGEILKLQLSTCRFFVAVPACIFAFYF